MGRLWADGPRAWDDVPDDVARARLSVRRLRDRDQQPRQQPALVRRAGADATCRYPTELGSVCSSTSKCVTRRLGSSWSENVLPLKSPIEMPLSSRLFMSVGWIHKAGELESASITMLKNGNNSTKCPLTSAVEYYYNSRINYF